MWDEGERDQGLKIETGLIHTPNPYSRSLGVRSVIEEAEEIISTERKHLEEERERRCVGEQLFLPIIYFIKLKHHCVWVSSLKVETSLRCTF